MTSTSVAIRQPNAPALPTVAEHRRALEAWRETEDGRIECQRIGPFTRLLPRPVLVAALAELDAALAHRPGKDELKKFLALLVVGYRKADLEDAAGFMQLWAYDMQEYPPSAIAEAVTVLRRTSKFFPSIAECRAAAENVITPLRRMQMMVRRMVAEHDRRETEAREEAKRIAADERYFIERHARIAAVYGLDGLPSVEDLEAATRAVLYAGAGELRRWREALDTRQEWALTVWRRFCIVGNLLPYSRDDKISGDTVLEILELAEHDPAAARKAAAAAAEAARSRVKETGPMPSVRRVTFAGDLERELRGIIRQIEYPCPGAGAAP